MLNYEIHFSVSTDHDVKKLAQEIAKRLSPFATPITRDSKVNINTDDHTLMGWTDHIPSFQPIYSRFESLSFADLCDIDFALWFESQKKHLVFTKTATLLHSSEKEWRTQVPPLQITFNKQKEFHFVNFFLDSGSVGKRALEFQAALNCLEKINPQDPKLIKLKNHLDHIQKFEKECSDYSHLINQIEQVALDFTKEFSADSSQKLRYGRIHERDSLIPKLDSYQNELQAWSECLHWDGYQDELAKKYLIKHKGSQLWADIYKYCTDHSLKGTWDNLVEILGADPCTDEDIIDMLSFLFDINWPGAWMAFDTIKEKKEQSLKVIAENLKNIGSKDEHLDSWKDTLTWVQEELTGSDSDPSSD